MNTRALGKTDIRISPVIFGAWAIGGWMWGGTEESDALEAIHASLDNGINTIDTAAVYGMGHSETLVAKAIRGRREKVVIATKGGRSWTSEVGSMPFETTGPDGKKLTIRSNSRPEALMKECEDSLRRLETDVIDLYQIHWPDLTFPIADAVGTMARLKEQGKIRAIGVSNFNLEQLEEAVEAAQIDALQPAYSLVRRDIEAEIVPFCEKHSIAIIPYSPMERGLLTGSVGPERTFAAGDHRASHPLFTVENRRRILAALEEVKPIADKHGASFAQIVINWTVQQPGITGAIVGARNASQAKHNAGALRFRLDGAELSQLSNVFAGCKSQLT